MLRGLVLLLAAVACLWIGGFLEYLSRIPEQEQSADAPTDGLVVLTGGANRLDAAIRLLIEGKAKRLLISGVDRRTSAAALQSRSVEAPDLFACCVDLGHEALDTMGNARETALWVEREGHASLRLVTAAYHMPRSLFLFRQAMPDLEIRPHPVFSESVRLDAWWRWPGTAVLLGREFNKYIVSLLSVRLGIEPAPGGD